MNAEKSRELVINEAVERAQRLVSDAKEEGVLKSVLFPMLEREGFLPSSPTDRGLMVRRAQFWVVKQGQSADVRYYAKQYPPSKKQQNGKVPPKGDQKAAAQTQRRVELELDGGSVTIDDSSFSGTFLKVRKVIVLYCVPAAILVAVGLYLVM